MKVTRFDQFEVENVLPFNSDPIQIQTKTRDGKQSSFAEIPLTYDSQPLFLELPPLSCDGIKQFTLHNTNNVVYSLSSTLSNEHDSDIINKLNKLQKRCLTLLKPHTKTVCKVTQHWHDETFKYSFKPIVQYPLSKYTSDYMLDKNPRFQLPLSDSRYGNSQTVFVNLKEDVIPWSYLENVRMTVIPVIRIDKIYVEHKISLRYFVASAIVTKIEPLGYRFLQTDTIKRINSSQPDLANEFETQMKRIVEIKDQKDVCTAECVADFGMDQIVM